MRNISIYQKLRGRPFQSIGVPCHTAKDEASSATTITTRKRTEKLFTFSPFYFHQRHGAAHSFDESIVNTCRHFLAVVSGASVRGVQDSSAEPSGRMRRLFESAPISYALEQKKIAAHLEDFVQIA